MNLGIVCGVATQLLYAEIISIINGFRVFCIYNNFYKLITAYNINYTIPSQAGLPKKIKI